MRGDAPTYDELARQVAELSQRLESLERREATGAERRPQAGGGDRSSLTRRRVLRGAAATGVGAVAGAMLASAPAAHAAAGDNMILGANNAGSASTTLQSTASNDALVVNQTGNSGTAIHASADNSTGSIVVVDANNTSSSSPALWATAAGSGFAVYGLAMGTERAIAGHVYSTSSSASAVYGSTRGTGVGIEGKALNGRGGKFTGRYAQINLEPGTSSTHPSHGGILGDLYVDLSARLWFCRGSNSWVQVV